ncbi:MAG: hypothetical protein WBB70_02935 [Desulfobacterales bacterium]
MKKPIESFTDILQIIPKRQNEKPEGASSGFKEELPRTAGSSTMIRLF